jgi:transaldolase
MSKEGGNPKDVMQEITKIIKGDVSLEVVSTEYSGMMEEGKRLRQYGKNVVVKVPMTSDGLKACKSLSSEGIPVNVTLVFSPNQALLAAKSGAKYVSPFIGRLDDIGQDGMKLIKDIKEIFDNYKDDFKTQILVASIRHPVHVIDAAKIGAHVVTLPPAVLDKMLQHPLTNIGLENFLSDWKKLKAGNPDIKI